MARAQLIIASVVVEGRSKSEVAGDYGVSRYLVQQLVRRFEREGPAAYAPRSRRPRSNPHAVDADLGELIVRLRKELSKDGLDAGAETIAAHLDRLDPAQRAGRVVPATSTIWRILSRRGFVTAQPQKRPRSSWKTFCADQPHERWQGDVSHWALLDATEVEILNLLDDHSRLCLASDARRVTRGPDVVTRFLQRQLDELPAANSTDPPGVLVRGRTGVELVALFGNRLRAYSVVDHVWRDLATNEPRDGPWTSVGTTSDHRFLVAKSERRLSLLDGKTGQEKFSVSPDTAGLGVPASGNLDASGERFAWWSTQGGAVTVVELASGRSTQIDVQGMSVSDAAFLADGRLAVASPSGLSVFSFGVSTTSTSWALPPDREPKILATDGNFLAVLTAAGSDQSQVLVFNNATGRPALDLDLLPGGPLRMIPGRRLTVVTFEKVVEVDPIWRDTQQLIRRLCASVSRAMTSAERERYLSGDRAKGCIA